MIHRDENPAGIHLPLDPLPGHSSRGRLERVLRRGEFAVTAELNPPDSADPQDVYDRAACAFEWADRFAEAIPAGSLRITFSVDDDGRRQLVGRGDGGRAGTLLHSLAAGA